METKKQELCAIDAELGDGDIGLTMSKGFSAVKERFSADPPETPGQAFQKAAMVFMNTVPSTMGTLTASAFLRAGKALGGRGTISPGELPLILEGMIAGISARGKAKKGDKTILDSLYSARGSG
jgi:dihydroxyacetone kinase-like protein